MRERIARRRQPGQTLRQGTTVGGENLAQHFFEWTAHARAGRAAGLSNDEVQRIAEGPAAGWSADDAALLQAVDDLFANDVKFLQSNGATMRAVRDGQLAWAFTDTDDYHVAMLRGHKVGCVFPDQHDGGIGTMLIPNAVGLVAGGPDQDGAKKLIDAILSRETEALLAAAESAQIPLRKGVQGPKDPAIKGVGQFREMKWDVEKAATDLARCTGEFAKRWGK